MKVLSKKLFWEIIGCQLRSLQGRGCPGCRAILDLQRKERLQIPEPWSGDIDNASVLFIGVNPALCKNEVFPSREIRSPFQWARRCICGDVWTEKDIEDYFQGRFGVSKCPKCKKGYFRVENQQNPRVMELKGNYRKMQNHYWPIYNQYYHALQTANNMPNTEYDFAVTDIVHCKGGGQEGTLEASVCCRNWTKRVIEVFVCNGASHHSILFVGRQYKKYVPMVLHGFNADEGDRVGTYEYKRSGLKTPGEMRHVAVRIAGKMVDVYYGIPAPSNANRATSNICFFDKKIDQNL